jgi:hypothetical protein
MYPDGWAADLTRLSGQDIDVVEVLTAMRKKYPEFGTERMRMAAVLRDLFNTPVADLHVINGWFAGNVSDDDLRKNVQLRH